MRTATSPRRLSFAAEVDANTSSQIKELNSKIEDLQKQISELVTARQEQN